MIKSLAIAAFVTIQWCLTLVFAKMFYLLADMKLRDYVDSHNAEVLSYAIYVAATAIIYGAFFCFVYDRRWRHFAYVASATVIAYALLALIVVAF